MKKIILSALRFYKFAISPVLVTYFGHACRYNQSCSEYSIEQIQNKGILKGVSLSAKRILSCSYWTV